MLRLSMLGSGSRGNALVVDNGETVVVVDAGFGCRAMQQRLQTAGYAPESVSALVLTHEHVDHAQGALPAARRWGWPIYSSAGTRTALLHSELDASMPDDSECDDDDADDSTRPVQFTTLLSTGTRVDQLMFTPHAVLHDAAEPVALIVEDHRSGARIGIAVDLGYAPKSLLDQFGGLDLLVLESNHDVEMLRTGPYPSSLKRRISSRRGHLSNDAAGAFAAACAHRGLRQLVLAHLSETNNRPEYAVRTVRSALARRGWRGDRVEAASQRSVTGPAMISSSGGRRPAVAVQLQLGLL